MTNRNLFWIIIFVGIYFVEGNRANVRAQDVKMAEAWAKFDFIPGHQLLFYDDLSGDRVGVAPTAWEVYEGETEVIEFEKQRWLRAISESTVTPAIETIPSQLTLEMDFYVTPRGYSGNYRIDIYGETDDDWASFTIEDLGAYFNTSSGISLEHQLELQGRHRLAMIVDGGGFKCYVDSLRVVNLPKAGNFRASSLEIYMPGGETEGDDKCVITNFRLAAAGKSFRDLITEQGKIVSYGIFFDKGSAIPKPESTPTLKEVATLLQTDVALNLSIECHANDVPDEGDNARLSQQRAEAVKEALISFYKINRDRLRTKGWGSSRPLEDEDTVIGHAMNARMEFVKR